MTQKMSNDRRGHITDTTLHVQTLRQKSYTCKQQDTTTVLYSSISIIALFNVF